MGRRKREGIKRKSKEREREREREKEREGGGGGRKERRNSILFLSYCILVLLRVFL